MQLIEARLLLSGRRAVASALAAFAVAASVAAALAASGRLFGAPSLMTLGMLLPLAAAAAGLLTGAVKVLSFPGRKLAAWLDLHTGAKGAVAAAAELPSDHPLSALISRRAKNALHRSGLTYLDPFLPAWAPLVLAAAALWGMAFLIPQAAPRSVTYEAYPGIVNVSGGGDAGADAGTAWQHFLIVRAPRGPAAVDEAKSRPLAGLPKGLLPDDAARADAASTGKGGDGTRAGSEGDISAGTSRAEASGAADAGSALVDTAPGRGRAGAAEMPLPRRWKRVLIRYEETRREESTRR